MVTTVLCPAALTFDPTLSKSCVDQASVPVCQAVVEGKKVTALRDTGATTLVVQRNSAVYVLHYYVQCYEDTVSVELHYIN